MPDGTVAIVKMANKPRKRCACGHWASRLCDFELSSGKTCDRNICASCATRVGPDRDLCPQHKEVP